MQNEIPEDLREELESKQNVVALGIGPKRTDDGKTGEEAIIVFVKEKLPKEELSDDDLVPSTVTVQVEDEEEEQEVKTDVIESGELYAQFQPTQTGGQQSPTQMGQSQMRQQGQMGRQGQQSTREVGGEGQAALRAAQTRRDRWRPAPAGVSIGHPEITAGTLGSPPLLTQDDETVFLTNAHVAAPPGVKRGDSVLQPGRADNGQNPEDQVGTVLEWSELSKDNRNESDSALVRIDDELVKTDILGLPDLKGWANARYDEPHFKSGRTTGVTNGELLARNVTANVNYGPEYGGVLAFEGLDVFTAMSAGGDSGSLIGRQKQDGFYASDLLFAGSDRITLGVPMNTVQDEHGTLEPIERRQRTQQGTGQRGMAGRRGSGGMGGQREISGQGGSQQGGSLQGTGMGGQPPQQMTGGQSQYGAEPMGQSMQEPQAGMSAQAGELEIQGASGLVHGFSGHIGAGETQHWLHEGWADKYALKYWVVPDNPRGQIQTTVWPERATTNSITWHIQFRNVSNYNTHFTAKYSWFS
ncbi:hypothetical protein SAMN05421858_2351 [Haladaptatus litoreus]|uniref:Trypsin-like peptidase domain-containing protein n=1 Tax=Haladaptatus litoreus TaxID=553468 RepID=A0A1N7B5S4_9EURY|nr:hypothetical protein [Haladaptatus litoreus]SIR46634.1 hypothetical protein SAMN05421858_2351 [Haladaptatus litoreus]